MARAMPYPREGMAVDVLGAMAQNSKPSSGSVLQNYFAGIELPMPILFILLISKGVVSPKVLKYKS